MLNTAQERRAFPKGAGDGVIGELSYLVSLLRSRVLGALRDIQKKKNGYGGDYYLVGMGACRFVSLTARTLKAWRFT